MKNNSKQLLENEIKRYNQILSYNNNSIKETVYRFYNEAEDQQPPIEDPNIPDPNAGMGADPNANPGAGTPDPNAGMGADPNAGIPDPSAGMTPPPDPNAGMTPPAPGTDDMGNNMGDMGDMTGAPGGDQATEIDVTELVNTTNGIAHRIEKTAGSLQKIYDKINDLEGNLSKMDSVIAQMGKLEKQIELMRPPTEGERRRALSDKSYPYSVSNSDYLEGVGYKNQTGMEKKPDKMSMMDTLMSDYDKNDVKRSFYPGEEDKRMSNF